MHRLDQGVFLLTAGHSGHFMASCKAGDRVGCGTQATGARRVRL